MRGRSSSKQGRSGGRGGGGSMENDKIDKVKEEPHLSGAYIRSLVKQLTSSRTKDPLEGDGNGDGLQKNPSKSGECISDHNTQQSQNPPVQPPQHKKQVRRRLHSSRPYQERLLNMAEARREIVTALKFHRASMKQQEANSLDNQSPPLQLPPPPPSFVQEVKPKSRRNPRIYASTPTVTIFSNNFFESYPTLSCPRPQIPYYWPLSAIAPPPPPPPPPMMIPENFNLSLPIQPLGLKLNFQDFNNLDTNLYHNPFSMYTSSSSSSPSASSPTLSVATTEELVSASEEAAANSSVGVVNGRGIAGEMGGGLHQAMDYEEMEEIRSIGEQHQMEWNDKLNLVTSARWFKFLKSMEIGSEEEEKAVHEDDDDGYHPFDQVMEFPPWLVNANETCCLQQHLDDHFSDDYLQDPALPCMNIEEIEGMEWTQNG